MRLFSLALVFVFLCSSFPAWSAPAYKCHYWKRQGGLYTLSVERTRNDNKILAYYFVKWYRGRTINGQYRSAKSQARAKCVNYRNRINRHR